MEQAPRNPMNPARFPDETQEEYKARRKIANNVPKAYTKVGWIIGTFHPGMVHKKLPIGN